MLRNQRYMPSKSRRSTLATAQGLHYDLTEYPSIKLKTQLGRHAILAWRVWSKSQAARSPGLP